MVVVRDKHKQPKKLFLPSINMKKGFTLIELLVGLGLVGTLMATGVVLLFTSLRTAKKGAAVGQVRSEGAAALNTMSQRIRYAAAISCNQPDAHNLRVYFFDNSYTDYSIVGGQWAAKTTLVNGTTSTVNLTSTGVTVSGCSVYPFSCNSSPPIKPSSVSVCFVVANVSGTDVTNTGSVTFRSEVSLRNYDQ